jgi:transcriptional regulator with XRE-family HTH domain
MTKDEVVQRLRAAKGRRMEICEATGVKYRWVVQLLAGKIHDPGASKLDALRAYFTLQDLKGPQ